MNRLGPGASEQMWRDAAAELGADVRRLTPTFLEFRLGSATTRVAYEITTPFTDRVSWLLMNDKALSYRVLSEASFPIPEHVALDAADVHSADAFLERTTPPLVVKPAEGAGGAGIAGHVCTPAQLRAALHNAGRFDQQVIIERQVDGDSYRLLFLDGRLLDVIRRPLPRLLGDGLATVGELMLREYERRVTAGADAVGFKPFEVDHDVLFALERGGLRLNSILGAGDSVVIKTATNFSGPEQTETVHDGVGEEVIAPARQAAELLGARLAGVDIVTTDPRRPLGDTGGAILEVNMPGLAHHYNVRDRPRATRVAVPVLAALLGLDVTRHSGREPVARVSVS
jgi:cyanophycin synthetase